MSIAFFFVKSMNADKTFEVDVQSGATPPRRCVIAFDELQTLVEKNAKHKVADFPNSVLGQMLTIRVFR
ncbi:hypothetical protein [Methyloversatilis sp.]|uniref:hypothetical protein n=1 Tax=Methyloversatilis sp. TaxID=2569862 RepID=UPI0035B2AA86